MILFALILTYLAAVNLKTYCIYADDKLRAIAKDQRIPEATLLWWAGIGGWGGAKIAQHRLRHKSYKQPFGNELNNIGIIHGMVAGTLAASFLVLALTPVSGLRTVDAAVAAVPPAPALLSVSLRPPAGRPSAS